MSYIDKNGAEYFVGKIKDSQAEQDLRYGVLRQDVDDLMAKQVEHYGLKIDKSNSDTSARIQYLYDAVGFTPAYMDYTNSKFEYGSWKNAFFVRNNYPVMLKTDGTEDYRLDPNDHSKKLDGTASDIADLTYDGNAFSCFDCHIWMKFYEDENYQYIEVSNYKLDDDFKDYPYHRGDGSIPDKLYYPMYPGYVDGDDKLRSISGVKATGYKGFAALESCSKNNGSIWSIESWSYHLWFHTLLLLMSKNFNSQVAFGNGNMAKGTRPAAEFNDNGLLNTSGQFFGYDTPIGSVKVFFCENVWGNIKSKCLGMYLVNNHYRVKMIPPYTTDGTFDNYQLISTPTSPQSNGWLVELTANSVYGLIPATVGGSNSTFVGDYGTFSSGGGYFDGRYCGSWHYNFTDWPGNVTITGGASLYLE